MPKSKTKRRQGAGPGAGAGADRAQRKWLGVPRGAGMLVATLAVVLAVAAWWALNVGRQESDFQKLAESGRAALSAVENPPSEGGGHLSPGQTVTYRNDPPTSGIHAKTWTEPGVYDTPQLATQLVHALEHGNIVIYYDRPDEAVLDTLKTWAGLYRSQWSGVIMVPKPGIGTAIVLSAWKRVLRLKTFDAAAAAAFIDKYRGRGPEHPVR